MIALKNLLNLKILTYAFFGILLVWIGYHLSMHIESSHGFILGDWLVNYHDGGFKRRGLSGSIFFILQDITSIKLQTLVFSAQMILYALFFFLISKLIYKKRVSLLFLTLILSPLTFVFFLNDFNIIGRKEILVYVIFAYFIYLKDKNEFNGIKEYIVYAILFTATFLHEIFIFYVPHFLIACYIFDREIKLKKYAFLFLSVLIPTAIIFVFGGLINQGESLNMLAQRGVVFPSGELNIFDFSNTLLSSLDRYKSDPVDYGLYSVSLLLGILHFSYYMKKEFESGFKLTLKLFLVAIGYSLPLFILVCDWGRWLQIHFILLFLILLAKRPAISEKPKVASSFSLNTKNIIILAILIPFFFTWRIYHFKWGFNLDGMLYFVFKKISALI